MTVFRQFKKSDWSLYRRIAEEAFSDEFITRSEEEFYKIIETEKDRFIGYFEGRELLGYTYFQLYSELSWLRSIAINQKYRGKGHGTALMEYVLHRFREYPSSGAMLYVETDNEVAINLYKKSGFVVNTESWHFIIPMDDFNRDIEGISLNNYSLEELSSEDLISVIQKFSNVNEEQMRSQMEKTEPDGKSSLHFLGLYDRDELVGFSRFSPSFSGSMPFEYQQITHADILVKLLETHYKLPDKEYIRITFDHYQELAELWSRRGYRLHHHMFTMKISL